ncbi:CopG family ribbon-helix-helix protein [Sulfuracidifex metallicus]|uniref:CopG family ribbon-helix-helix protein n=1 Tax=Sulfuracidifex metallicus TaxID=47303 RepID=UPI002275D445|nr:CopG family ribbon-helix-helix protein [Sulfuracidifex metallicus]MCY0849883.1 CopG family ribbon-helix-helix protein [Sulfuracidifex metallicus]
MSEKISVSLPRDLLKELEDFMEKSKAGDRSKVVQLALRNFLDENKQSDAFTYSVISVIYDFTTAESDFTKVQHDYAELIMSNMHVHVSAKECMEAIFVKGKKSEVMKLIGSINQIKGIKKVKPTFSYVGE